MSNNYNEKNNEISKLREDHLNVIQKLKEDQIKVIYELRGDHRNVIQKLKEDQIKVIHELRGDHINVVHELRNDQNKVTQNLREDHLNVLQKLRNDQIEVSNTTLKLLNEKLSNNTKLDITNNTDNIDWLSNEKNEKPEDYININTDIIQNNLKNIFLKIKTINDIINLKYEKYKYDYYSNNKFTKLYKLIPSLEELNNMIGMDNIKKDIFNTICYFIHGLNNKDDLNHIVITGDPGVGKTSLARIIGNIYLSLGFLSSNKFISAKRSNLIAEYTGQTSIKTQKTIDEAEGGVLFIDEVYSLGNEDKKDCFSKECIDTINQNLTEKCDKFLCIISGYNDDINTCFFKYNKGLERRFTIRYNIDKYTSTNLSKMLLKFIKLDSWTISFNPSILLTKNYELLKYQGADLKILLKNAKQEYSVRLMTKCLDNENNDRLLIKKDFNIAIEKLIEQRTYNKIPE